MYRQRDLALVVAGTLLAATSGADTPAFDRPGIAFSPTTLPAHSLAWEPGLPDFQRDRTDGVTQIAYAANTRLRYGISDRWEVQLAVPLFEQVDANGSGQAFTAAGAGDVSLALKFGLTPGADTFNAALLGAVSIPTAQDRLSLGTEQYSLGASVGWTLDERQSVALYANVDLLEGDAKWTISPNWSVGLTDTLSVYLEGGYQFSDANDPSDNVVAGGGLAWMVTPATQLDAYWLSGLTSGSTDLAAGFGVSLFFK